MKAVPYVAAALIAAMVIAGVIFYLVAVRPWVAMPDEPRDRIEARFAKIEALAALPGHCSGGRERLADAIGRLAPSRGHLDELLWPDDDARRAAGDSLPRLDPAGLKEHARLAIDALVEWHSAGGGLGDDPCDHDLEVLAAMRLADLALATADGRPDDPRTAAVLHLAHDLRGCGNLLPAMVGWKLAQRAVVWAEDRRIVPGATFERYRPVAAEVLPVLAREAVCGVRMVEEAFRTGGEETIGAGERPWYAAGGTTAEREVLMLEQHYADLIERAAKTPGDLDAIAAALEPGDPDDLPPSLVVRALTIDLSHMVTEAAESIAAYDASLSRSHGD